MVEIEKFSYVVVCYYDNHNILGVFDNIEDAQEAHDEHVSSSESVEIKKYIINKNYGCRWDSGETL